MTGFFDHDIRLLNGEPGELARFRGKVVLAVNLASR